MSETTEKPKSKKAAKAPEQAKAPKPEPMILVDYAGPLRSECAAGAAAIDEGLGRNVVAHRKDRAAKGPARPTPDRAPGHKVAPLVLSTSDGMLVLHPGPNLVEQSAWASVPRAKSEKDKPTPLDMLLSSGSVAAFGEADGPKLTKFLKRQAVALDVVERTHDARVLDLVQSMEEARENPRIAVVDALELRREKLQRPTGESGPRLSRAQAKRRAKLARTN